MKIKEQIEKQRDLIHKILNKEFSDKQLTNIWLEINELIELELSLEMECNK